MNNWKGGALAEKEYEKNSFKQLHFTKEKKHIFQEFLVAREIFHIQKTMQKGEHVNKNAHIRMKKFSKKSY